MENKNIPAFPYAVEFGGNIAVEEKGLTKREYFAAMAMQGLISGRFASQERFNCNSDNISMMACEYADALLAELSKPQP